MASVGGAKLRRPHQRQTVCGVADDHLPEGSCIGLSRVVASYPSQRSLERAHCPRMWNRSMPRRRSSWLSRTRTYQANSVSVVLLKLLPLIYNGMCFSMILWVLCVQARGVERCGVCENPVGCEPLRL